MKKTKNSIIYLLLISFILSSAIWPGAAYALDQPTMEYQWQRTYGRGIYGDLRADAIPVTDGEGNVYIVDTDGFVNCIASDGEIKYRVNIYQGGSYRSTGSSAPVVDESSNIYIPSGDGNIYSFAPDGSLRWKYKMDTGVAVRGTSVLSPDEKTVYSADEGGRVYAVNTSDGKLIWRTHVYLGYGCTGPVLNSDGSVLYIGSYSNLAAFDTSPGVRDELRQKWISSAEQPEESTDSYVFYDMSSGNVRHERPLTTDDEGNIYALSQKYVSGVGVEGYYLHKFSPEGKELWRTQVSDAEIEVTPPLCHKGMIYYKTSQNKLYKLDSDDTNPKPELILAVGGLDTGGDNARYRQAPVLDGKGNMYIRFGGYIYVVNTAGEILRKSSEINLQGGSLYITKPDSRGNIYVNTGFFLYMYRDTYIKQVPGSLELQGFAMEKGTEYVPEITVKDERGDLISDSLNIFLESGNDSILKVDGNKIKAVNSGSTTLKASIGSISTQAEITVVDNLLSAKINITSLAGKTSIALEEKIELKADIVYNNLPVKGKEIVWESKHPCIAAVDSKGIVTGVTEGKARIDAHIKGTESVNSYIAIGVSKNIIEKVRLEDMKEALAKSIGYYRDKGSLTDWTAYVVNGAGVDPVSIDKNYVEKIKSKIQAQNGAVGTQMTDYERTLVGLVSAGQDVTHFVYDDAMYASSGGTKGYIDFIREIRNGVAGGLGQGINAAIWGLAALNAVDYDKAAYSDTLYNEDYFIEYILKNKSGEGWAFGTGGSADPDMTGMALYALAPYRDDTRQFGGTTVKAEGMKAIKHMGVTQLENGRFGSWGTVNSCSSAQVIMGIVAWGIDPQGEMFTKKNGNALTGLMSYYLGDGTFKYTNSFDPSFGTPQSLEGLISVISYYESSDDPELRRSTAWEKIKFAGDIKLDIKSISILPGSLTLTKGQEISLTVITNKGNTIDGKDVEWSASPDKISVKDGKITASDVFNGNVTARYSYEGQSFSASINLVVLSGNEYELTRTGTVQLPDFENTPYEFVVKNNSGKDVKTLIMVNLYKESDDSMVQQVAAEVSIKNGKSQKAAASFRVPEGDYYIKILLWDGFDNIKSLKGAITIQGVK